MTELHRLQVEAGGVLKLDGKAITLDELEQKLERDKAEGDTTEIRLIGGPNTVWPDIEQPTRLLQRFDRIAKGAASW